MAEINWRNIADQSTVEDFLVKLAESGKPEDLAELKKQIKGITQGAEGNWYASYFRALNKIKDNAVDSDIAKYLLSNSEMMTESILYRNKPNDSTLMEINKFMQKKDEEGNPLFVPDARFNRILNRRIRQNKGIFTSLKFTGNDDPILDSVSKWRYRQILKNLPDAVTFMPAGKINLWTAIRITRQITKETKPELLLAQITALEKAGRFTAFRAKRILKRIDPANKLARDNVRELLAVAREKNIERFNLNPTFAKFLLASQSKSQTKYESRAGVVSNIRETGTADFKEDIMQAINNKLSPEELLKVKAEAETAIAATGGKEKFEAAVKAKKEADEARKKADALFADVDTLEKTLNKEEYKKALAALKEAEDDVSTFEAASEAAITAAGGKEKFNAAVEAKRKEDFKRKDLEAVEKDDLYQNYLSKVKEIEAITDEKDRKFQLETLESALKTSVKLTIRKVKKIKGDLDVLENASETAIAAAGGEDTFNAALKAQEDFETQKIKVKELRAAEITKLALDTDAKHEIAKEKFKQADKRADEIEKKTKAKIEAAGGDSKFNAALEAQAAIETAGGAANVEAVEKLIEQVRQNPLKYLGYFSTQCIKDSSKEPDKYIDVLTSATFKGIFKKAIELHANDQIDRLVMAEKNKPSDERSTEADLDEQFLSISASNIEEYEKLIKNLGDYKAGQVQLENRRLSARTLPTELINRVNKPS